MGVLPTGEGWKLLIILAVGIILVFVGQITNGRDNPRIQLFFGITSLLFAVLIFFLGTDDAVMWESIFLFLLGLLFLGRYWSLTRPNSTENAR